MTPSSPQQPIWPETTKPVTLPLLIDDRALSDIKGYAKRQWDDFRTPPDNISLILMGLAYWLKVHGAPVPFEIPIVERKPNDSY